MSRTVDESVADRIAAAFALRPHPEGGSYVETWREAAPADERPASSAILFLLRATERSAWHRVDATEIWHWHTGGPLELRIAVDGEPVRVVRLGPDVLGTDVPQAVVPAGAWQAARPIDGWVLVGCSVAPAFELSGFELAPEGWEPG